jgi:hypothetical protein
VQTRVSDVRVFRSMMGQLKFYLVAVGVEEGFEIHHIWMRDKSHDLEFSVLRGKEKKPP